MLKIDVFNKFKELFSKINIKNKKLFLITFVLVALVFVLFFTSIFPIKKTNKEVTSDSKQNISISEYACGVENKLKSMLLSLDSFSKVSIFVMIDSLPETKYLTETEEQSTTSTSGSVVTTKSTTVVFEKNGSISSPVAITTIMPKITGVLIVTNKISPSTKLNITNAIASVLNIDQSCISILQES